MPRWQERLFIWLAGRAEDATEYFRIPTDRVVEVGTQVMVYSTRCSVGVRPLATGTPAFPPTPMRGV